MPNKLAWWAWSILVLSAVAARGDVRLPALFSDHMVLQQGAAVPVWGWADAAERVTVTAGEQKKTAVAGEDGKWRVVLDSMRASSDAIAFAVEGTNRIELADVVVGEVWVASGQSNMEWPLKQAANAAEELAAADNPRLRMFTVKKSTAVEPAADVTGAWEVSSPTTAGRFSAVGYFFARQLVADLKMPVGIIHSSWGGTPAEAWTSRATLQAHPALRILVENADKAIADYDDRLAQHAKALAVWEQQRDKARAEGKPVPQRPRPPLSATAPSRPANLYNAMLAPLVGYGIRGVIWYQGEANAGRPQEYRTLFPTMIQDWRKRWGQGDFAFLFVQLANFRARRDLDSVESNWALLREAQALTLAVPKTGMAVTIDIGDERDIHPRNKQDVGRRLARAAMSVAYGQTVQWRGPTFRKMAIADGKVRIDLDHARGLKAREGQVVGFVIAGEDRHWHVAEAKIDGQSVVVWSDQVPKPVAVRYAWADAPQSSLYNDQDLPAGPFRTDDWAK